MLETQPRARRKRPGLFAWWAALLALIALLGAALLAAGVSPPYDAPQTPPLRDATTESNLI